MVELLVGIGVVVAFFLVISLIIMCPMFFMLVGAAVFFISAFMLIGTSILHQEDDYGYWLAGFGGGGLLCIFAGMVSDG